MAAACWCRCRGSDYRTWNMSIDEVPSNNTAGSCSSGVGPFTVQGPDGNLGAEEAGRASSLTLNYRKKLRAPICVKLTVFICLAVMVASGVPELVLWKKVHQQLVGQIEHRLMVLSTLRQEQLQDYLLSEADKTQLIAIRIVISNYLNNVSTGNKTLAKLDLQMAISVISDFMNAAVYDSKGHLVLETEENVFQPRIEEASINTVVQEIPNLQYPVETSNGWMYTLSRGIHKGQKLIGQLMVSVNATKLVSLVYDRTGLQETGELLVGIPDGPDKIRLLLPAMQKPNVIVLPYKGAMAKAINGESGILKERNYRGARVIAAYRPAGFLHWGALASLGLAKAFTSPIIELGKAAFALGQGDMRTRVKKGSSCFHDEFSNLKDAFNGMAHRIASHQYILEHEVSERTSDLAHAHDGLAREVEERKRIELELEKAKDIAMAADRSKSEFLANMSHEIRTPLNAIINFTELCLDTQITQEQQEHLEYVQFAAQHLLRLITDILDFNKIAAGKLEMEEIQFSLYEQLEQSLSVLAARAWKSGLELCCDIHADVPDQLLGDPGRLLQIFVNLVGNGIKFTKKGEVIVSVTVNSKSADDVELLFAVKDSGLGIPQTKQSLLFQAFSQVDSSTQRLYGGTGLGLAISSKLAAAMGGRMWVESEGVEGLGSTFSFTGRFKLFPSNSSMNFLMFKGVRALVVDDNSTGLRILTDLLKSWNIIADGVMTTEAAKSALELGESSGHKYNVVLLDMWLGGVEALDLVEYIRARPDLLQKYASDAEVNTLYPVEPDSDLALPSAHCLSQQCSSKSTPDRLRYGPNLKVEIYTKDNVSSAIIMLTSVNHMESSRCKELGLPFHTSKPIRRSLLNRVLRSALGFEDKMSHDEGKTSKESKKLNKRLHVLIAEDNPVNQRVAIKLLHKWGHTTVLAVDGAEAVERSAKEEFDIILMDVQMPVCDGFEATAKIREYERSHNRKITPIVAMTAHAMMGDGEYCIAAGMDYYISKPLNAKKLQDLLQYVATSSLRVYSASPSHKNSMSMW
ncbi:hypothetical protein KP509_04G097600 [Ceratopteris richardii]|uniref:histidine kinase n=2 Tax=Ceratopteris richardii TaxID=49495 RepID=A0A8T2UYC9_CERRI|nr:hypothetical protein KP509_04G097600 [Ceratopteris richardii]